MKELRYEININHKMKQKLEQQQPKEDVTTKYKSNETIN